MADFQGKPNSNDRFVGTESADTFAFAVADLTRNDRISGAGGVDTLRFTTPGTVTVDGLNGVKDIERIEFTTGTNGITLTNYRVGVSGGFLTLIGGDGRDVFDARGVSEAGALNIASGAGADVLKGGEGADTFRFAASALLATDYVVGGEGPAVDRLVFATAGTVSSNAFAHVRGIEQVVLATGGNTLSLSDAFVVSAYGKTLSVVGSSGNDAVNAAAVGDGGHVDITAGSGVDTLRGGQGDDVFRFRISDLAANDKVAGGAGDDTLAFTTAGTAGASAFAGVSGVQRLALADGVNAVTLNDAMFAGGATKLAVVSGTVDDTVDARALKAGHSVDFTASTGIDRFYGGAGDDTFSVKPSELTSEDRFFGGAGFDTLVLADTGVLGSEVLVSSQGVARVREIERIVLSDGGNTLYLSGAFVRLNTAPFQVIGSDANDIVGSGGAVDITAGFGLDRFTTSGASDIFRFSAEALNGDTIDGGGYNWKWPGEVEDGDRDTLVITTRGEITVAALANVMHVEQITLAAAGTTLHLAEKVEYGGFGSVEGSSGDDVVDASQSTVFLRYEAGGGDDTLTGGTGADWFKFKVGELTQADKVAGGDDPDRLIFTDAGAIGGTQLSGVTGIETIELADGTNALTIDAGFAARNANGLEIVGGDGRDMMDASTLGGAARVNIASGLGSDVLKGGAGDDTFAFSFRFVQVDFNTTVDINEFDGDTVAGGAGTDTLYLTARQLAPSALANVRGIEEIVLSSTRSLSPVFLSDATVTSATASTVAVKGTAGHDRFDASAVSAAGHIDLYGRGGADTLIGGAGADTYRTGVREEATDTIVNFSGSGGQGDHLVFASATFNIAGNAFDSLTTDATGSTSIAGADGVLYTGGTLQNAAAVRSYLAANGTGSDDDGVFVVARASANHTVLYHARDASGLANADVVAVMDFGSLAPTSFQLADFQLADFLLV